MFYMTCRYLAKTSKVRRKYCHRSEYRIYFFRFILSHRSLHTSSSVTLDVTFYQRLQLGHGASVQAFRSQRTHSHKHRKQQKTDYYYLLFKLSTRQFEATDRCPCLYLSVRWFDQILFVLLMRESGHLLNWFTFPAKTTSYGRLFHVWTTLLHKKYLKSVKRFSVKKISANLAHNGPRINVATYKINRWN